MTRMTSKVVVALVIVVYGGGCARLKPYERGRLAHPTMLLGDLARPGAAHVYSTREGAIGGGSGAEGGCGCN
jgi:hypothetical protein